MLKMRKILSVALVVVMLFSVFAEIGRAHV